MKKQENGQFKCPYCPYVHERGGQINRHISELHQDVCDINISAENGKRNAKKENNFFVTNESGNVVFSCSNCGMKFSGFDEKHIKKCWNNIEEENSSIEKVDGGIKIEPVENLVC